MKVSELSEHIARHDPRLTKRQGIPTLDDEGQLVGIITRGDLLRTLERGEDGDATVLDAGSSSLIVAYRDEVLQEAVVKMLRNDIGRLPVVDRKDPQHLVGYLGRAGVMAARVRQHEEEYVREQGLSPLKAETLFKGKR